MAMCKGPLNEIPNKGQVTSLVKEVTQQLASDGECVRAALNWVLEAASRSRFNMYLDFATIIMQLRLAVSVDQADMVDSLRIHDLPPYPEGVRSEELTSVVLELIKRPDQLKDVIELLPCT